MGPNDLLSQEEIDALLHGIGGDEFALGPDHPIGFEGVRVYDFSSEDRIVRGQMPVLDRINERFSRFLRNSLFQMLRRAPEISLGSVEMAKYGEYVHTLFVPTSINMVKVRPLRGTGLIVIDPKLVFILVDNYFGGNGRFHPAMEGREFTPTEQRVIRRLLNMIFADLGEAWAPVTKLDLEFVGSEVNPDFATVWNPAEVVVTSRFHVELEGGGGELHVTLPYSMLEPIRDALNDGLQRERGEKDEQWLGTLRESLDEADVELTAVLPQVQVSLRDLLQMKKGDVIPIEVPDVVTLRAEHVPLFRGKPGLSKENIALEILEPLSHATDRRR